MEAGNSLVFYLRNCVNKIRNMQKLYFINIPEVVEWMTFEFKRYGLATLKEQLTSINHLDQFHERN